jgi:outer membrane immunogenic protein
MKPGKLFTPLLAALVLVAGPSLASTEDVKSILLRLDALEQSTVDVKQQNALLQRQNALLREKVRELAGRDGAGAAAPTAPKNAAPTAAIRNASANASYAMPVAQYWNGAHIGVFSGYALGRWTGDAPDYPHQPVNGWLGGIAAGYDVQLASGLVAGIEVDTALADVKQTDNYKDAAATLRMDNLSTLRGRFGYAWDRSLVYVTGGLAVAHVDLTVNQYHPGGPTNPPFQATADNIEYGYALGGGYQWAILDGLSFKSEYLWVDLAKRTYALTTAPGFTGTSSMQVGWSGSVLKSGFNLKFD